MMIKKEKWLICGTRIKNNPKYKEVVFKELDRELKLRNDVGKKHDVYFDISIIHGNCPDSADIYADEWAKNNNISVKRFPSSKGGYLTRNVEMVSELSDGDDLIAFWNGYSYGTAHTIAQGILQGTAGVTIIDLFRELN